MTKHQRTTLMSCFSSANDWYQPYYLSWCYRKRRTRPKAPVAIIDTEPRSLCTSRLWLILRTTVHKAGIDNPIEQCIFWYSIQIAIKCSPAPGRIISYKRCLCRTLNICPHRTVLVIQRRCHVHRVANVHPLSFFWIEASFPDIYIDLTLVYLVCSANSNLMLPSDDIVVDWLSIVSL